MFDGRTEDIVRYHFHGDHGPGMDDHSDSIIYQVIHFELAFEKDARAK